jgi:hypothetical protein
MESVSLLTNIWSWLHTIGKPMDSKPYKEAQMKKRFRINYIFWKEGPLLPGLLASTNDIRQPQEDGP